MHMHTYECRFELDSGHSLFVVTAAADPFTAQRHAISLLRETHQMDQGVALAFFKRNWRDEDVSVREVAVSYVTERAIG